MALTIALITSSGCAHHVQILEAEAGPHPSGDILIRFKTDEDILLRYFGRSRAVHVYMPPNSGEEEHSRILLSDGHCTVWDRWIERNESEVEVAQKERKHAEAEEHQAVYAFRCRVPSKRTLEEVGSTSRPGIDVAAPYDLSEPGTYLIEFWAQGYSPSPGGFETPRVRLIYVVK